MELLAHLATQLNEEQYLAATHTTTSSLILAGAGSGKTRVLTYKIAYLMHSLGIYPSQILAVTFTNKASQEMKTRIREIHEQWVAGGMGSHQIQLSELKRMGTFHSVFLRFLKESLAATTQIESGDLTYRLGRYTRDFGVCDDGDSKSALKKALHDLKLTDRLNQDEAKAMISKLKNKGITARTFLTQCNDQREEDVAMTYEKYEKYLQSDNLMDFDDLLLMPYLMLKSDEALCHKRQTKFRYILVDEAQDTNWIQFELMKLLSVGGNITFIGDDFQSIYRWRGAVMDNFLAVQSIWSDMCMFKLQTNYRSRPHIVHAGNQLIKNNIKQYEKVVVPHRDGNEKIAIVANTDEMDEASNVITLIKKFHCDQNIQRSDVAILYRKNAQSSSLEQVLIAENIPYKIFGGLRFLERKEIKDIVAYMRYIYNTRDTVALKRIINTPKRAIGLDTIAKLDEYALTHDTTLGEVVDHIQQLPLGISARTISQIQSFQHTIALLRRKMDDLTPSQLINTIIDTIQYKEFLIESEGKAKAEEKIENLGELINLAAKHEIKVEEQ